MGLSKIIKGYVNHELAKRDLLDQEVEKEAQRRLNICKRCSIYDIDTDKCVKNRGGCGCRMQKKSRCRNCTCPKNKW